LGRRGGTGDRGLAVAAAVITAAAIATATAGDRNEEEGRDERDQAVRHGPVGSPAAEA
jgi:hypothetical protein